MHHGLLLPVVILAGLASAQPWQPGKEFAVDWAGTEDQLLVFLPENYDSARRWPVLLYYHGTNGKPRTDIFRAHTGGRDWVIVGMTYRERGLLTLEGQAHMVDYTRKEVAQFHRVREALSAHLSIEPARIYLGGLSKGGWITSMLGNAEPQSFAGFIMLMGGRQRHLPASPQPKAFEGKPYFIAVGEEDNNYVFSRLAEAWFGRLGAVTTFRSYPGLGHDLPRQMPTLERWLQLEADPKALAVSASHWFDAALKEAREKATPLDQYRSLKTMFEDPQLRALPPDALVTVRAALNDLVARIPAVRELASAERRFKQLMVKEMQIQTLAQMRAVRDGYLALRPALKGSDLSEVVDQAAARVHKALLASEQATRDANR